MNKEGEVMMRTSTPIIMFLVAIFALVVFFLRKDGLKWFFRPQRFKFLHKVFWFYVVFCVIAYARGL